MGIEKSASWALVRLVHAELGLPIVGPVPQAAEWGGWPPAGSDNQKALAGACSYLQGHPEARAWALHFYGDQVANGLDRGEQLSNTYHHLHGQAAAAVLEVADHRQDGELREVLRQYWRGQLGLWALVASPVGRVAAACCRASWEDNDTRNVTLQLILDLPLERPLTRPWWRDDEPGRRAQSPLAHRRLLAAGRWDVLTPAEVASLRRWVAERQPSDELLQLVSAARLRQPMHVVVSEQGSYSWAPSLLCWDDPQPAAAVWRDGRVELLRAKQDIDWWFPEAVTTQLQADTGRLLASGTGHRGSPGSPLEAWQGELTLPGGTAVLHLLVGPQAVEQLPLGGGSGGDPAPPAVPRPLGPRVQQLLAALSDSVTRREAALAAGDDETALAAEVEERLLLTELGSELGL